MATKNLEGTMRITIPPTPKVVTAPSAGVAPVATLSRSSIEVRKVVGEDSQYQEVLRSLYDGVLITDQSGKITYANVRAVDFLKFERQELYQHYIYQIFSGADLTLMETLNQNLENQRFTYIEAYCIRKDGSMFPAEIAVNKFEDPKKGHLCFFVRDITRRKQVEEELHESVEKTRALLNATPDLMFRIERSGVFLDFKAATEEEAEESSGYIGKNIREVFPDMAAEIMRHVESAFQTNATHIFEYQLQQQGGLRHYEARIVARGEGEAFAIVRDITERKEKIQALQAAKDQAETQYRILLEQQLEFIRNQRLYAVSKLASNAAHEISNPVALLTSHLASLNKNLNTLRRLMAHYQVLGELAGGGTETKRKEVLERIEEIRKKENVEHLLEGIDTLFGESKKGVFRLREVANHLRFFAGTGLEERHYDLNQGIESALDLFASTLNQRCQIRKNLGEIPEVRCVPLEINQVVMILLMYAAESIEQEGEVIIESEVDQNQVILRVSHTGKSIPHGDITKIFHSLIAGDTRDGTGLDLPLAHSIIQKHKGTIDVRSEEPRGVTFTVRLPVL